jgi:ribonuclease HI
MNTNYTLITDGAYSPIRDQGGVGIVFLREDEKILEYSKSFKGVTNNQMELGAVILGLRFIKSPIDSLTIVSDSMYVIGCATLGWKRKKNVKLWEEFDKQFSRVKQLCPDIKFKHVKGHTGDKWNEYCDKLASNATQLL